MSERGIHTPTSSRRRPGSTQASACTTLVNSFDRAARFGSPRASGSVPLLSASAGCDGSTSLRSALVPPHPPHTDVIPAQAGIHASIGAYNVGESVQPYSEVRLKADKWRLAWIPACAGIKGVGNRVFGEQHATGAMLRTTAKPGYPEYCRSGKTPAWRRRRPARATNAFDPGSMPPRSSNDTRFNDLRGRWRRRRDSNPRYALTAYNDLANRRLQPLGHVSSRRRSTRIVGHLPERKPTLSLVPRQPLTGQLLCPADL